jgi:hypothetical protein
MLKTDNLLRLAAYLDTLPANYAAFDMNVFFAAANYNSDLHAERVDADVEKNYGLKNGGVDKCGAVACAIGHGPSAGFLVPEDMITLYGRVSWMRYSDHFFIDGYLYAERWEPAHHAWSWCFDGDWAGVDNTPHGAAKRIRWLVKNGVDAIPVKRNEPFIPARHHVDLYADA